MATDARADARVTTTDRFADVGEGVLGLQFAANGDLLAAVPGRGLLALDPAGNQRVLTDRVGDMPLTYTNELDIARDGTVYFSDSSSAYRPGFPYDFLDGRPHGRLLSYHPDTNSTTVLLDGIYFANGVALSPAEDFVVVAESFRYRLLRVWLAGPKAGQSEVFADNLPVAPDNVSIGQDGTYWVGGGGGPRSGPQDLLQGNAWLKLAVAKLVPFEVLRDIPNRTRYGFVLRLSDDGAILASYHDPTGRVHTISSAEPYGGAVYLGTLYGNAVGRVVLP